MGQGRAGGRLGHALWVKRNVGDPPVNEARLDCISIQPHCHCLTLQAQHNQHMWCLDAVGHSGARMLVRIR